MLNESLLEYKLSQVELKLADISSSLEKIAEVMTNITLVESQQKAHGITLVDLQSSVAKLHQEVSDLKVANASRAWLTDLGTKLVWITISTVIGALLALVISGGLPIK